MKALYSLLLIKIIPFLLFRDVEADCRLFEATTCGSITGPTFGPESGGTVVQITLRSGIKCEGYQIRPHISRQQEIKQMKIARHKLRSGANFLCKFENTEENFLQIVPARIVDNQPNEKVECLTPFNGRAMNVTVSYAAVRPSCRDVNAFLFVPVNEEFQYFGRPGLIITGSDLGTRFFSVGTTIEVEWNAEALGFSALENLNKIIYGRERDLMVDLQILVYRDTSASNHCPFEETITLVERMPIYQSKKEVHFNRNILRSRSHSKFLNWGSITNGVAVILIRVVAYSPYLGKNRILATRTSNLIGVFPSNPEKEIICPINFNDDDCENADQIACPPSQFIAEDDSDFESDVTCPLVLGSGGPADTCNPRLGLELDLRITRGTLTVSEETVFENEDGCPCQIFHNGAAGCVNDGMGTQCCYTEAGPLIIPYDQGGGRPVCKPRVTTLKAVDIFLFNELPFLFCCGIDELGCVDYYAAILPNPPFTDIYTNAMTAAVAFGDPHLITFNRVEYDFRGGGEYIAACSVPDESSTRESTRNICQNDQNPDRTAIHLRFGLVQMADIGSNTQGVAIQDPTFFEGTRRLLITRDATDRLRLFVDDERLRFNGRGSRRFQNPDTARINVPADTNLPTFRMIINFASNLRVRIDDIRSGGLQVDITRPETGQYNFFGLYAPGDTASSLEFISGNGTQLDLDFTEVTFDNTLTVTDEADEMEIFDLFAPQWRVNEQSRSLFRTLPSSELTFSDANETVDPFFTQRQLRDDPITQPCAGSGFCTQFDDFVERSCIVDFCKGIDMDVVIETSLFAQRQLENRRQLLNNLPVIKGGQLQTLNACTDQWTKLIIEVFDEDDDQTIGAEITTNEVNAVFSIENGRRDRVFVVMFKSSEVGPFEAVVSVTDGVIIVLVTINVIVTLAPPKPVVRYRKKSKKHHKRHYKMWT